MSEMNWQTEKLTIRERNEFMFNNDLFSDVKFVVPRIIGESENKRIIPAHKFVLPISSPVFEAMFYGELAETRDSIELPDCEYDSLLELFRYIYSDEVSLNGSNVMGVFYLAKKYMVPSLAGKCARYLEHNLDASNAFSILPFAQKYEEKNLVDRCWKMIDEQTEEAVKSDEFATVERSLLEALVIRNTLTIEEIELFKAVDLWATKACERQGLAADGKTKRRILGEEIVKAIRFPIIKQEDFASVVLDSKILTPDEVVSIIKYLSSVSSSVGFSEIRRTSIIQRCYRFGSFCSVRNDGLKTYNSCKEDVYVSVDRDIKLHGVSLFGRENTSYSIDLNVTDTERNLIVVSKTGKFSSEHFKNETCSYYRSTVIFDREIVLTKNTTYRINAAVYGPLPSCLVSYPFDSVTYSNVTFTFSGKISQFPESLLFSL